MNVSLSRLWIGLFALAAVAADAPPDRLLNGVEARYNRAKTLQVLFKEVYTPPSRPSRTESGTLLLRKPGKMRWDYSQPKGKLFVGDGRTLWLYTPAENKVEKIKMSESDDMRAPLAFLLGKLDFDKEFRHFEFRPEGSDTRITAVPKTDNLPYSQVEFVVTPDFRIRQVKVTSYDRSVLDFSFDQEKLDPPLDGRLFQFKAPPGATVEGEQ